MTKLVIDTVNADKNWDVTLVRVRYGDNREPWIFQAFRSDRPSYCVPVDDHRVLVTGKNGELALFDTEMRKLLKGWKVGGARPPFYLSHDHERLFVIAGLDLTVIDIDTFEIIQKATVPYSAWESQIGERKDGQFILGHHIPHHQRKLDEYHGIHVVNPGSGKVQSLPLRSPRRGLLRCFAGWFIGGRSFSTPELHPTGLFSEPIRWISPDGRYALRRNYGELPFTLKPAILNFLFRLLKGRIRYKLLGNNISSVGLTVEIWSLGKKLRPKTVSVSSYPWEAIHMAQDSLKVMVFATQRSGSPIAPWIPEIRDTNAMSLLSNVHGNWRDFLNNLRTVAWEPNSKACWLLFSDGSIRRLGMDGSLSPLVMFERKGIGPFITVAHDGRVTVSGYSGQVGFHPREIDLRDGSKTLLIPQTDDNFDAATADGDRLLGVHVPLRGVSEAEHIEAIQMLAKMVRDDLPELVRGYFFRPFFIMAEKTLNEAEFFASVRANAPGAGPALSDLMLAYVERTPDVELYLVEQIYGMDEEAGALAHAMHALVLIDPGAMPLLKAYISVMDAEHEEYTRAQVIPDFFQAHGWPNEDRIRFALNLYLSDWYRGDPEHGNLWQGLGMRKAVQRLFSADSFADRVIAWIGEGRSESETDYGISNFVSGNLGKDDPFDEEVVLAFKARRPDLPPLLEPWEKRFAE